MRASSGGAGSLARVTRRPSGPSGTVSMMPLHHVLSIRSQFALQTSTTRAPRDEETVVCFISFFFILIVSLSKANLAHPFSALFLTWILLSEGCSQKCRNFLVPFNISPTKSYGVVASTSKDNSPPLSLDVCVQLRAAKLEPMHCSSVRVFSHQCSHHPLISAWGRLDAQVCGVPGCSGPLAVGSGGPWRPVTRCVYALKQTRLLF